MLAWAAATLLPAAAAPNDLVEVKNPGNVYIEARESATRGPWVRLSPTRVNDHPFTFQARSVFSDYQPGQTKLDLRFLDNGYFYADVSSLNNWLPGTDIAEENMTHSRQPNWLGDGLALALLGAIATGFYRLHRHRLRQSEEQVDHVRGYFPTDGSLTREIGGYPVTGRLGNGGMAMVYAALDSDRKPVAIKVPLPNVVSDPEFVRRFNREMKLGVQLRHPRLTRIDYFQPAGEGTYPFIVMEQIQGTPMDQITFPVPLQQALEWTGQILEVLEVIHGQGVIHRDLKPSNLFVTNRGIKVTDLGIAHNSGTIGGKATQTGTILGTPAYLDPAMIQFGTVNAQTDLYAVGLILFEMIAGKLPYPEEPMEIITQKLQGEMAPLCSVKPEVPLEVSEFVRVLSRQDPQQRFESAESARHALQCLQDCLK